MIETTDVVLQAAAEGGLDTALGNLGGTAADVVGGVLAGIGEGAAGIFGALNDALGAPIGDAATLGGFGYGG